MVHPSNLDISEKWLKKGAVPYKIKFDESWICKFYPRCSAGASCQWQHVKPAEKIDWDKYEFPENSKVEGATAVLPGDNTEKENELKNALIESMRRQIEQLEEQLLQKGKNNKYQT